MTNISRRDQFAMAVMQEDIRANGIGHKLPEVRAVMIANAVNALIAELDRTEKKECQHKLVTFEAAKPSYGRCDFCGAVVLFHRLGDNELCDFCGKHASKTDNRGCPGKREEPSK